MGGSCPKQGKQAAVRTKIATLLATAAVCLQTSLSAGDDGLFAAFDEALSLAGLSRDTARFDSNILRFYRFDEFTMPSFDAIHESPYRAPFFMDLLKSRIKANAGKPNELLMLTRGWTGYATRRTLLANPTGPWQAEAKKEGSLEAALSSLGVSTPDLQRVPAETQQAAALVLIALRESKPYRDTALREVTDLNTAFDLFAKGREDVKSRADRRAIMRKADLRVLYAGGHDLLLASQVAAEWANKVNPEAAYSLEIPTQWGPIRLRGAGDHTTPVGESLLIIDTGGEDAYIGGGYNYSPKNWASIIIDTNGRDSYLAALQMASTPVAEWPSRKGANRIPSAGGALFGYAFVIDTDGSDLYRSDRPGQGSATFGVGVVLDTSGDDTYDSYIDSQGFGRFGVGILADTAGNDTYLGFNQVQGCGLTGGVGILADSTGNDIYTANDSTIDFPSPQSAEHNVSMAQGAGYGLRADYSDGHSLGGGLGVLFDGGGNDRYSCAVFGQGVGYWQGIGAIMDEAGNDEYFGMWYVQGACAHFAVGYLEDVEGNDKYTATMNMAQGAGHDFSAGYLLDRAGDDSYSAPNLSLGAGNANGIGIFVDFLGDDNYNSKGTTLGKANPASAGSVREIALCLGLFLDLSGNDTYTDATPWAGNGEKIVNWNQKLEMPSESRLGIFFDSQ